MKALITGGAGYVGSHVAVALHGAGIEPIIIDNLSNSHMSSIKGIERIIGKQVQFYLGDCCSKCDVEKVVAENPDIELAIHLAAHKYVPESVANPTKYYNNNIKSLVNVMKTCEEYLVDNLVFSSSCAVYGNPRRIPVDEEAEVNPCSPYGETKAICESILGLSWLKTSSLRYFNPIGAHVSGLIGENTKVESTQIIPSLLRAKQSKKPFVINGDSSSCRDYIHVEDVACAHVLAAKELIGIGQDVGWRHEIYNIGSGKGISTQDIVTKFQELAGEIEVINGSTRPGDAGSIYSSYCKANKILGWSPKRSLHESVSSAIMFDKTWRAEWQASQSK